MISRKLANLIGIYSLVVVGLYFFGLYKNVRNWGSLIFLFNVVPGIYFVTIKTVGMQILKILPFTKNNPKVKENNVRFNDLYQRIVRATYALYISVSGISELIIAYNTDNIFFYTSNQMEQLIYSLSLFYVYDTFILISSDLLKLTIKPDVPMYIHHISLVICYIATMINGSYRVFAVHLMVAEFLVPFGVLLHWTKFFEISGIFPLITSILGFGVIILLRVPIQLRLLYLFFSNWSHPSFSSISFFYHALFFSGVSTALYLERTWGFLYFTNITKLLQELKQSNKKN